MPDLPPPSPLSSLSVVLAGGSGFLGTHLRDALTGRGHTVTSLVRRPAGGPDEATWDPYADQVPQDVVDAAPDMAGELGNGALDIALHREFEQGPMVVGHRCAAKAGGEHVITDETVKHRRMQRQQRL